MALELYSDSFLDVVSFKVHYEILAIPGSRWVFPNADAG